MLLEPEEELLEEAPSPEELELLDPGVIPPSVQPCKAITLAATKIKARFFIFTILSKCARPKTFAAAEPGEFVVPKPSRMKTFYSYIAWHHTPSRLSRTQTRSRSKYKKRGTRPLNLLPF